MLTFKQSYLVKNKSWRLLHEEKFERKAEALVKAISHLNVSLTAMCVALNEVSSHLCKILTLVIVKIYLQTGARSKF